MLFRKQPKHLETAGPCLQELPPQAFKLGSVSCFPGSRCLLPQFSGDPTDPVKWECGPVEVLDEPSPLPCPQDLAATLSSKEVALAGPAPRPWGLLELFKCHLAEIS